MNTTYLIVPHDESLAPGEPCEIDQMTDYDLPTPWLWCHTHGDVAGEINPRSLTDIGRNPAS